MEKSEFFTGACVQGGSPPCTFHCPIGLDVRRFIEKLKVGNFTSAYLIFANASVFPAIVCELCGEPCRVECPPDISLRALEQAAVRYTRDRASERFNLPKRSERIAVIGAGLSGLACAYRLASKRYDIELFDQDAEVGGYLRNILPEPVYTEEFLLRFEGIAHTRRLGLRIDSLDAPGLSETGCYDAVYVATGEGGADFELLEGYDGKSLATTRPGFFIGGGVTGADLMHSLAHGLTAAASIESYLKTGRVDDSHNPDPKDACRIRPPSFISGFEAVRPANGAAGYTKEETVAESERCILCDCTLCYDTCEFMKEQKLMPRQIELRARNDIGPAAERIASKMIASCTLCGHCEAICDFGASVEKAMLGSKKKLFESGRFAPAYHDFYMRDLKISMGQDYLCKAAPGREHATYVFFPGCQAAGANPLYVTEPYRYMLEHDADTALLLSCCGAPALYAGDESAMREVHGKICSELRRLSDPYVVYACASCAKNFAKYLPEIRLISLFEYIQEKGLPGQAAALPGDFALFDPCASRSFPAMQEAVRNLLRRMDASVSELPENQKHALCCGHGGHIYAANPKLSKKFTETAARLSDEPYMTYCTNCRDLFLAEGKQAAYLMDPLFAIEPLRAPRHLSQRAENRRNAIPLALRSFWGEDEWQGRIRTDGTPEAMVGTGSVHSELPVRFPEGLLAKMDGLLISAEEIEDVVRTGEKTRSFLVNATQGTRITHKKIGLVTCWAEYRACEESYQVVNAYMHRMEFIRNKQ